MTEFNKKNKTLKFIYTANSSKWEETLHKIADLAKQSKLEIKDVKKDLWIPAVEIYLEENGSEIVTKLQSENNITVFQMEDYHIKKITENDLEIEYLFAYYNNDEIELNIDFEAKLAKIDNKDIESKIDNEIANILKANTKNSELKRGSKVGDFIIFDFEGKKDGVPFAGGSAQDYELELGAGRFIESLESQLIGLKAGEKRDLDVTFPKDYGSKELAGQKVVFSVNIKKVFTKKEVKLTDTFVKNLKDTKSSNIKELRAELKSKILYVKENENQEAFLKQALLEIAKSSNFKVHEEFVEKRRELSKKYSIQDLEKQGITFKQYLEMTKSTEADFEELINHKVINDITLLSVESLLINKLDIQSSKDDVNRIIEMISISQKTSIEYVSEVFKEENLKIWAKHYALINYLLLKAGK